MQKDLIIMDEVSSFGIPDRRHVNVAKSAKPVKNILKHHKQDIISALHSLKFHWLANSIKDYNFNQVIGTLPKWMINELYWKLNGANK
jgi:nucleoside-triphosphatase THEP1